MLKKLIDMISLALSPSVWFLFTSLSQVVRPEKTSIGDEREMKRGIRGRRN